MRSKQYRAWTSARNCVACTCTVTASQPFRVWGLFTSWRWALQPCPMCCTNALMLLNLHCSCLSVPCMVCHLAVLLELHVLHCLITATHLVSWGVPGSPRKASCCLPAHGSNLLHMCTEAHAFLSSNVMNHMEVWRAVSEPTVLPMCVKFRHDILCKMVCRCFGWLTTRSAI